MAYNTNLINYIIFLICSCKIGFDIINVSETTQINNQDFASRRI